MLAAGRSPGTTVRPVDEPGDDLTSIERWFVERGVPHFVERSTEGSALDTWTRALPLLIVAYLLLGLQALNLRSWSTGQKPKWMILFLTC